MGSKDSFAAASFDTDASPLDDSTSKYSSDSKKKGKTGVGQDKVKYWVDQLPLQSVLDGVRKVGVEIRQADLALSKLEPGQVLQLRGHIQCARWATWLSHERTQKTEDELMQAVDGLLSKQLKLPGELQVFMWSKQMQKRTDIVIAEAYSAVSFESWLSCILPFHPEGKSVPLDWRAMKLWSMDVSAAAKVDHFMDTMVGKVLVVLIQQGDAALDKLRPMLHDLEEVA